MIVQGVRVIAWFAAAVLLTGCGREGFREEGYPDVSDCLAQLDWNGVAYWGSGDLVKPIFLGERLGKGRIPGCGNDPDYQLNVVRIRGVSPSVAVAVAGDDWPYAWLAPGYLPESPLHPLHAAIYGSSALPDAEAGYLCGRPRSLRARAISTPSFDVEPLRVSAEDKNVQRFLLQGNTDGIVTVDAETTVNGFELKGIPFVQTGDQFALVLRDCTGRATNPGQAGLRRLVVEEISP
jgi:hypothetical protein